MRRLRATSTQEALKLGFDLVACANDKAWQNLIRLRTHQERPKDNSEPPLDSGLLYPTTTRVVPLITNYQESSSLVLLELGYLLLALLKSWTCATD